MTGKMSAIDLTPGGNDDLILAASWLTSDRLELLNRAVLGICLAPPILLGGFVAFIRIWEFFTWLLGEWIVSISGRFTHNCDPGIGCTQGTSDAEFAV